MHYNDFVFQIQLVQLLYRPHLLRKTHEMLSLLSQAVASAPDTSTSSDVEKAKMLLHKCVSQFSHQQQIHAQQAARYLRGLNDTMMSHKTIPMLSSLLLS